MNKSYVCPSPNDLRIYACGHIRILWETDVSTVDEKIEQLKLINKMYVESCVHDLEKKKAEHEKV